VVDKNSGVFADIQLLLFHFYGVRRMRKRSCKNHAKKHNLTLIVHKKQEG
jgi:hypothetical protein